MKGKVRGNSIRVEQLGVEGCLVACPKRQYGTHLVCNSLPRGSPPVGIRRAKQPSYRHIRQVLAWEGSFGAPHHPFASMSTPRHANKCKPRGSQTNPNVRVPAGWPLVTGTIERKVKFDSKVFGTQYGQ